MANLPISCWAREDIPTNRAEELGYKALSDVELLSIIIGSGSVYNNSVELAREVLYHCNNNVKNLSKFEVERLGKDKVGTYHGCDGVRHKGA